MARVWTESVGCKVSRADAEELADRLAARGHVRADGPSGADVAVLTTCCVTAEAERSSRQRLRRLRKRGLPVVVTGCAVVYRPAQFDEPRVRVAGIDAVPGVVDQLADAATTAAGARYPTGDVTRNGGPAAARRRTRAVIKVQDGCTAACAYCAVRLVRGGLWSLPLSAAVRRAEAALAAGCGEVVVSGINLGLYSDGRAADALGGPEGRGPGLEQTAAAHVREAVELPELIDALTELPSLRRLRLSSLEPLHVTPRLLKALRHAQVARHLHLPLQSADDGVLADMRRPYTYAEYLDRLHAVKDALPDAMISTDVIVGFPTESTAAFERTLSAIGEHGPFGRVHVFTFSPRPGTAAADLPPLPAAEVRRRRTAAAAAARSAQAAAARRLVGQRVEVLAEEWRDGLWRGYSSEYVRCLVTGTAGRGELVAAKALRTTDDGLWCEVT